MRIDVVDRMDRELALACSRLLDRALLAVERDDRFDVLPADDDPAGFLAATATATATTGPDAPLVAYLGGGRRRGRLQLDALVADGEVDAAPVLGRLWRELSDRLVHDGNGGDDDDGSGGTGGAPVEVMELWGRPARPWHRELAEAEGLVPVRALHQMRCRLPVATGPVPTRPFDPDRDLEALMEVNNRAFASHPDQGRRSLDDLRATMAQPWFRADGLRILEGGDRMIGFCWTKIHRQPPGRGPDLGEIYVIGVDPDHHGQGLGGPLTAAGLAWLHDQGLGTGMLYVEADNAPAVATYRRLGFTIVRTDRAWAR